jgi:hypothetical protein
VLRSEQRAGLRTWLLIVDPVLFVEEASPVVELVPGRCSLAPTYLFSVANGYG